MRNLFEVDKYSSWAEVIEEEKKKDYFKKLKEFVERRYKETTVYPEKKNIFRAFSLTKYNNLKVVILGQDPYHQPNQAVGLAFSVPKETPNPPSLINILKEVKNSTGKDSICLDGDLSRWAVQGVLLLNAILTVERGKPLSHANIGWEIFTDNIIKHINDYFEKIIFLLWGANAIKKAKLIDKNRHFILTAPHPSPLSAHRGFLGSNHFKKANEILASIGKKEIIW